MTEFSGETLGGVDKVTVTLKAGKDYDAPWVVIHGASVTETADLLGAVAATGLLALVAESSEALKGHYNAGRQLGATPVQAPAAAQAAWQAQPPQAAPQQQYAAQPAAYPVQQAPAPQAPAAQPPGPAPSCPHGVKVYSPAGHNARSGKAFGASWQCPLKAADWRDPNGCPPQWISTR